MEVSAIARASSNPHSVEVFPSYMAKVSKANLYLKCGHGPWSEALLDGSRNNHILTIDCSNGVSVLEKQSGKIDASQGDVHQFGNAHYWLNPQNNLVVAQNITTGLQKTDPDHSAYYASRLEQFKKESIDRILVWKERLKTLKGVKIIT